MNAAGALRVRHRDLPPNAENRSARRVRSPSPRGLATGEGGGSGSGKVRSAWTLITPPLRPTSPMAPKR